MKLHSPALEAVVVRRVREAVHASPGLQREHKRTRKARHYSSESIWRLALTGWLVGVLYAARGRGLSTDTQMAILTVWGAVMVLGRASHLVGILYSADDLYALFGLPASSEVVFRWEWQKFVRGSVWTLLDFGIASAVLFGPADPGPGGWLLLAGAAVVQGATIVILAMALVAWRPSALYGTLAWLIGITALVGTILSKVVAPYFFAGLDRLAASVNHFLPSGWILLLVGEFLSGRPGWTVLVFLLPLGVIAAAFSPARRRLVRTYHFSSAPEPDAGLEDDEEMMADRDASPAQNDRGPTEILDSLRERSFLQEQSLETAGPLERLFYRHLTPREQWLVEMMSDAPLVWSALWKRALIWMAAGVGVGWLWQQIAPRYGFEPWWMYVLLGGIAGLLLLPAGGGFARCFRPWYLSGTGIPFHAGFPVSYVEIASVNLKSALVRTLAGVPLLSAYGAAVFWLQDLNGLDGALLGLKIGWIVIAARPGLVAYLFSAGSNDTRRFNFVAVVILTAGLASGLVFLGLGATLVMTGGTAAWICALLLPVPSYAFSRFYGWMFNRNRFDLMHLPQQT